jgi:sulfofructose kinase
LCFSNTVIFCKARVKVGFCRLYGYDLYGDKHYQELIDNGVAVDWLVRGSSPTPLSTILVKPDGKRALINYKGETLPLSENAIDFTTINPKVVLFDGHEPRVSVGFAKHLLKRKIPMVLDAGSLHEGTQALVQLMDYPVCSEKFALQWAGSIDNALTQLAKLSNYAVITLGERGLVWQHGKERGDLPAFNVNAVDTTGAGDAFHGAFAAALASGMNWNAVLK